MNINAEKIIRRGVSRQADPVKAAKELSEKLNIDNPDLVVFFASPAYDQTILSSALAEAFGNTLVVGCSTAGEITPDGYIQNSITGFSLPDDDFQVQLSCLENLSTIDLQSVYSKIITARRELEKKIDQSCSQMNTFCMSLSDSMSMSEEIVAAGIHMGLEGLPMFGGSAGDGIKFKDTWLYYKGELKSNCAILLLVYSQRPFQVFKTEHFSQSSNASSLVVTEADPEKRIVWEIDAEPAVDAYARTFELDKEHLSSDVFANHPLVIRIDGTNYVRSIQKVIEGGGLLFYCAIERGIILHKTEKNNIVADLRQLFDGLNCSVDSIELVIGCDCIHRYMEARVAGELEQVSDILLANNVVGFSTYGEQLSGLHINQTFTGIVISAREK